MPQKVAGKNRGKGSPDIFSMGAAGAAIGRSAGTARHYARNLLARGTSGILVASNGDLFCTPEGLEALKAEAQRPGRSGTE